MALFDKVLIANRGEAACRIQRTLKRLGMRSVAVFSEADRHARHVLEADSAICIGPSQLERSYSNANAVLDAARVSGVQAIHPGYGFLSQNADFAAAVEAQGLAFVGPTPAQIHGFSTEHLGRNLAERSGLPLLPGSEVSAESVSRVRHIEVQIFGDGRGQVVSLGERDCSAQRPNRKLIEEAPAPNLDANLRLALTDAAVKLGLCVSYRSAGTVRFVLDSDRSQFFFLDFETHLQPEHGITEALLGIDLVEWMLRTAASDPPDLRALPHISGHAIEARIYAEDPARDFKASTGLITLATFGADARVETCVERGTEVSPLSDPLLAKLIAVGADRPAAIAALVESLGATRLGGIETNLDYVRSILEDPVFLAGELTTETLCRVKCSRPSIEVLSPGTFSIAVDYPGRLGYWDVGIPPSGPMDALAHRLANRIVGNPERSATLELTLSGPTLRFSSDAVIALTGARMLATLDAEPVVFYRPLQVRAGQTLQLGNIDGPGARTYLAVRGGLDLPEYLGSCTTFTLGGFGGHGGRALRRGDVLHVSSPASDAPPPRAPLPLALVPTYTRSWQILVLHGPHGAPDFFTPRDIDSFFSTDFEVHYNSNRTGIRLLGPKPEWARPDGGEAGLHPSNIHDVAYAVGAVDFTGDMPILLGPDGPSLGGFVCPATVIQAELWKLGQLRPGDRVRFVPVAAEFAAELEREQDLSLESLGVHDSKRTPAVSLAAPAVIDTLVANDDRPEVVYRRSGDKNLLVEYGPLVLDLKLRFRVHALVSWLKSSGLPGILDLTPGIRSLQVHYDSRILSSERLLSALGRAETELPKSHDVEVPTRVVRLPLSWNDPATRLAIQKYTQSVRPDAPWCPSNIEFIRRINGLESQKDVYDVVFNASFLVLGLGDVYLGAPVATPIDPRQRLVTTKYNPARTWTPENAVGIGGAYLCIYGMEGPGGYQFVGRTLQVYNRFRATRDFRDGTPWLLRFFDQIQFYPVSAEELLDIREAFPYGKYSIDVAPGVFRLADYERFLARNADSISAFKARQQAAFDAERQRWLESGQLGTTRSAPEPKPVSLAGDRTHRAKPPLEPRLPSVS